MKVVILCGGKGTRIRDVSEDLPKPMIPIGPYPIVKHIMDIYSHYGHNEFILCLGYKGWVLKEYFLNYRAETTDVAIDFRDNGTVRYIGVTDIPPWVVIMARTGLEAMTGCRIKRIQKYVGNETFLLTYGDGVGDVDLDTLVKFHKSHGRLATITCVRPPSRFGEMTVQKNAVTSFAEKPQTGAGFINGGFFVCEPGVFDYVTDDEACAFEREPLSRLARDRQLTAYFHDGFWMPMDTAREYTLLNDLWSKGKAPWVPTPRRRRAGSEL